MFVHVLECHPDLSRDMPYDVHAQRLVPSALEELLQVAACHVLHHDAVVVLVDLELVLEAHDVWAVLAPRVHCDLLVLPRGQITRRRIYYLQSELLVC